MNTAERKEYLGWLKEQSKAVEEQQLVRLQVCYADGSPWYDFSWKGDKEHGVHKMWSDGEFGPSELFSEVSYFEGKLHGTAITRFNGKINQLKRFDRGVLNGLQEKRYTNGRKKRDTLYVWGKLIWEKRYFECTAGEEQEKERVMNAATSEIAIFNS